MSKELDYIADLERENRLLGERCNQLLKDKGELTDKIADIKANCDLAIEGRDVKIKELKEQIEKMRYTLNKIIETVHNDRIDEYGARLVLIKDFAYECLEEIKENDRK